MSRMFRVLCGAAVLCFFSSCQRITFDYANTPAPQAGSERPSYSLIFPGEKYSAPEGAKPPTDISLNMPVSR